MWFWAIWITWPDSGLSCFYPADGWWVISLTPQLLCLRKTYCTGLLYNPSCHRWTRLGQGQFFMSVEKVSGKYRNLNVLSDVADSHVHLSEMQPLGLKHKAWDILYWPAECGSGWVSSHRCLRLCISPVYTIESVVSFSDLWESILD